jgi:hypothetical protein
MIDTFPMPQGGAQIGWVREPLWTDGHRPVKAQEKRVIVTRNLAGPDAVYALSSERISPTTLHYLRELSMWYKSYVLARFGPARLVAIRRRRETCSKASD